MVVSGMGGWLGSGASGVGRVKLLGAFGEAVQAVRLAPLRANLHWEVGAG